MSIDAIRDSLDTEDWRNFPLDRLEKASAALSNKDKRILLTLLEDGLAKSDVRLATNSLLLGLHSGEEFLSKVQKNGLLRLSKSNFENKCTTATVSTLLSKAEACPESTIEYLVSIRLLHYVGAYAAAGYRYILEFFERLGVAGLKGLLASVDFFALTQAVTGWECNKEQDSRQTSFFSVEELCEAASFLLAAFTNEHGPISKNPPIPPDVLREAEYADTLLCAAHLVAFRNWEILVDRYGYQMNAVEDKIFELSGPDDFVCSCQLGFINSQMQRDLDSLTPDFEKLPTYTELGRSLAKVFKDREMLVRRSVPIDRFVLQFDARVIEKMLSLTPAFREEAINIGQTCKSLLTDYKTLRQFRFSDSVTMGDIFEFSKLVAVLRATLAAEFEPLLETEPETVLNSLLPSFRKDSFLAMLDTILGQGKGEGLLNLLALDSTGHVDLQYRPSLAFGEEVILFLNIASNSNLPRNILASTRARLYEDGREDPLSAQLRDHLLSVGLKAKTGVEISGPEGKSEIDVVAYGDGLFFFFECKNPLLPTGNHELLTTFDHVKKGSSQLARASSNFKSSEFRKRLAQSLEISPPSNPSLSTAVVLSNRMLNGYRCSGHPVRNFFEIASFVKTGDINLMGHKKNFWKGDKFVASDLCRFLNDDVTIEPFKQSLLKYHSTYLLNDISVKVSSVKLNALRLAENLGLQEAANKIRNFQDVGLDPGDP